MTEAEKKTAAESTQSNGAKSKTPLIIGAIVVVVVVIAAIVAFLTMNQGGGNTEGALSLCERNAAAIEMHQNSLTTVQESADALDLDGADEAAIEALETAQEEVDAVGEMPVCPADGSVKDIEAVTEEIKTYANDLRAATNDLDAAVKALAPAEE
ncbi:hypothetical protein [Bifidobacterium pullorum]|uniref:hypothetical protein n=1 Tax=Bifidobacterium pullorum TaxID=78448 RepID=UPI00242F32C4|nr:hypothetical protein [Bifidobacterium pullorum]